MEATCGLSRYVTFATNLLVVISATTVTTVVTLRELKNKHGDTSGFVHCASASDEASLLVLPLPSSPFSPFQVGYFCKHRGRLASCTQDEASQPSSFCACTKAPPGASFPMAVGASGVNSSPEEPWTPHSICHCTLEALAQN